MSLAAGQSVSRSASDTRSVSASALHPIPTSAYLSSRLSNLRARSIIRRKLTGSPVNEPMMDFDDAGWTRSTGKDEGPRVLLEKTSLRNGFACRRRVPVSIREPLGNMGYGFVRGTGNNLIASGGDDRQRWLTSNGVINFPLRRLRRLISHRKRIRQKGENYSGQGRVIIIRCSERILVSRRNCFPSTILEGISFI